MFRRLLGLAAATTGLLLVPTIVSAQTAERRWQLEIVGGLSLFELPTSGDAALPPQGPALLTDGPTTPSRRIPTWFLGDGATLLNGANAEFGVASRLMPLDDALGRLGLTGANAPVMGVRVRRALTSRWSLDLSTELWTGSTDISPELLEAVELSRASFETAFADLFSTGGPFTSTSVQATATVNDQTSRELAVIASVRYRLLTGSLAPYLTVGGGLITRTGDLPSLTLVGTYAFRAQPQAGPSVPFAESDTLTLRFEQAAGPVGMVGGGIQSPLSSRVGFALDGRVYLSQDPLNLRLESRPTITTGTPADYIQSSTAPAVQFSNNTATGRHSTLSGTPLDGFKAFTTSGLQMRYSLTAGVFIRF